MMKTITPNEAAEWCKAHGVAIDILGLPNIGRDELGSTTFVIPDDAGKRTAMVKSQMTTLLHESTCLVWLHDWSVWPSGQWHHIFERFRLSYGCKDSLMSKPAHLVEKSESDAAMSIAVYAVLMLWDCFVVTDDGKWLYYSHDQVGRMKD